MTGDELSALRKRGGLKGYELARRLGYSPQRWSEFERGHAVIPPVVECAVRWVMMDRIVQPETAAERAIKALAEALERDNGDRSSSD